MDRDPDLIEALETSLKKYGAGYGVVAAPDGKSATELLRKEPITLAVCNLKVPKGSDIAFLEHVFSTYPDVGVIAITGLSADKLRKMVKSNGSLQCIEQPHSIEAIVSTVRKAVEQQSEGGVLYQVSTGMFLQLIEMEQRTCTIRLMNNATRRRGALFFKDGILLDARSNGLRGEDAAYEIFSWDRVSLWIQNSCSFEERRINKELQAVILEAMRRKDEAAALSAKEAEEDLPEPEVIVPEEEESETVARVRKRLGMGNIHHGDIIDIREDNTWDSLLAQSSRIGAFFEAGELKVAYVDRGDQNDYLVVPEERSIVVEVDPKCPRDKFIKLLLEGT